MEKSYCQFFWLGTPVILRLFWIPCREEETHKGLCGGNASAWIQQMQSGLLSCQCPTTSKNEKLRFSVKTCHIIFRALRISPSWLNFSPTHRQIIPRGNATSISTPRVLVAVAETATWGAVKLAGWPRKG